MDLRTRLTWLPPTVGSLTLFQVPSTMLAVSGIEWKTDFKGVREHLHTLTICLGYQSSTFVKRNCFLFLWNLDFNMHSFNKCFQRTSYVFFYWHIINLYHCVNLSCKVGWFDTFIYCSMITTSAFANTFIISHTYFFVVVRTIKI